MSPYLLWRVIDEHGAELGILLQKRRDKVAVKRVFQRVLPNRLSLPALDALLDQQRDSATS